MMYGLTMSLKNEIVKLAPRGRVNCIGPGWVRTVSSQFSIVKAHSDKHSFQPMATESLKNPNVAYAALAT